MISVRLNFDPATILYRAKLFARTSEDIPKEAVPLPSFNWEIAKAKSALAEKDVLRTWMRYFSLATASIGRRSRSDFAFVALVGFDSSSDNHSISFTCPFPEVVETLRNREALAKLIDEPEPEVQYKFAVMRTMCPMVFVYSANANRVLVTNDNHQRAPKQFLDVDQCDRTSAMLNFIGAMNWLNAAKLESEYAEDIDSWLHSAMNLRRDEWLRWFFYMAEQRALFDPGRCRINAKNPEQFFYDYSGKK